MSNFTYTCGHDSERKTRREYDGSVLGRYFFEGCERCMPVVSKKFCVKEEAVFEKKLVVANGEQNYLKISPAKKEGSKQ